MAGCMKMTDGLVSISTKLMVFTALFICLPQTSRQETANKHPVVDLRDGEELVLTGSNRFCYKNSMVPTWRQTWTRIQVKVWSSGVFKVETVEGEEEMEGFSMWSWLQGLLRSTAAEDGDEEDPD